MPQGGTRTHDLAKALPYSNQLSYQVTWQLWLPWADPEIEEGKWGPIVCGWLCA